MGQGLDTLKQLERKVDSHTLDKSCLHHTDLQEQHSTMLTDIQSKMAALESDINKWNHFDEKSAEMMDAALAIEHEVASVVLPDDAAGKQSIVEHLQVR